MYFKGYWFKHELQFHLLHSTTCFCVSSVKADIVILQGLKSASLSVYYLMCVRSLDVQGSFHPLTLKSNTIK